MGGGWAHPIGYGYQVPFAERIRTEAGHRHGGGRADHRARAGRGDLAGGQADLVALAREAQDDPNLASTRPASSPAGPTTAYPIQAGPRLGARERVLEQLGPWTGPDPVQVEPPA